MRLIDADALINEIDNVQYSSGSRRCWEKMRVKKQPTIDAMPIVHARRLNPGECGGNAFGPCSACGAWYDISQGTDGGQLYYCPHCGAKMDRGANDD